MSGDNTLKGAGNITSNISLQTKYYITSLVFIHMPMNLGADSCESKEVQAGKNFFMCIIV